MDKWITPRLNELFKKQKKDMKNAFSGTKQGRMGNQEAAAFSATKKITPAGGQKKILPKDGSGKQLAQFGKVLASSAYCFKCKHINAKING